MSRSASARSRLQIGVLTVPAGIRLAQQKQSKHAGLDGRSDGLLAERHQLYSRRDLITKVGRPLLRANELREGLFRPGMAVPGVAMVQRSPRARVGQSPPRLRPQVARFSRIPRDLDQRTGEQIAGVAISCQISRLPDRIASEPGRPNAQTSRPLSSQKR